MRWEKTRGRLVSQMAGLFVWAVWHRQGLLHLSEHSRGPEHTDRLPQSPLVFSLAAWTSVISGEPFQFSFQFYSEFMSNIYEIREQCKMFFRTKKWPVELQHV